MPHGDPCKMCGNHWDSHSEAPRGSNVYNSVYCPSVLVYRCVVGLRFVLSKFDLQEAGVWLVFDSSSFLAI